MYDDGSHSQLSLFIYRYRKELTPDPPLITKISACVQHVRVHIIASVCARHVGNFTLYVSACASVYLFVHVCMKVSVCAFLQTRATLMISPTSKPSTAFGLSHNFLMIQPTSVVMKGPRPQRNSDGIQSLPLIQRNKRV